MTVPLLYPNAFVLSGPPCSGKTTLLNHIQDTTGWQTFSETARELFLRRQDQGMVNPFTPDFSQEVFKIQLAREKVSLDPERISILDRSIIDPIAYERIEGRVIAPDPRADSENRYRAVFMLEAIPFQEDGIRRFEEDQQKISDSLIETYKDYGYEIIFVPAMDPKERAVFIVNKVLERLDPKS